MSDLQSLSPITVLTGLVARNKKRFMKYGTMKKKHLIPIDKKFLNHSVRRQAQRKSKPITQYVSSV